MEIQSYITVDLNLSIRNFNGVVFSSDEVFYRANRQFVGCSQRNRRVAVHKTQAGALERVYFKCRGERGRCNNKHKNGKNVFHRLPASGNGLFHVPADIHSLFSDLDFFQSVLDTEMARAF